MQNTDAAHTRNFALIGHAGDGKTTLGEALLHTTGAVKDLGSVDGGTSHLDSTPEEKERHHTLVAHVYGFDWNGLHLTLVDTPGDPNFQGDAQIALKALDGAILVVSAVGGAKVGTESMYRAAEVTGVPLVAFVSCIDKDRADFAAAVESLRGLDANPVPLAIPMGAGPALKGVIDLVSMRALLNGSDAAIPKELMAEAAAARAMLAEAVAECDDALTEKYLEDGDLSDEELQRGLVTATRSKKLLPVLCGASTSELGMPALLWATTHLLPSAAERGAWHAERIADHAELAVEPAPDAPFSAAVFKTVIDRYAGTLSVMRVVSGTVHHDETIVNATRGEKERLGKLLLLHGSELVEVAEAGPGDVIAVAKLKDVHTGNTLTSEKNGLHLPEIPIPQGVISYAISAKSKADEDKLFLSLARLVEEDPTLHVSRDVSTGEFLLTGMGELHIRIAVQKLRRAYEVEVELHTPKVPYRETIKGRAENVEGKLKKQTGGKGMYGVAYISVEPLPRGSGVVFSDEIVGGAIPRNLIPAVEKGVQEAALHGPLAGFPVVDVKARCIDGKFHTVDSNEMAFKLAGSFGFRSALEQAKPTLLEPIMHVEVTAPADQLGDIMGDLAHRRGRVSGTESRGHGLIVKAEVPMAEMLEYASALTSLTGGKGAFHMEFSHYDEMPALQRERVIAEAKAKAAART
ncbi:MAG: elongation factor G [Deltaproteobacteria bacterium]|nr:elongation factor G [Deltaproteobacteria bacterium]